LRPESYDFLAKLIEVPSPSGFEQPAARIYDSYCREFADKVETDIMGSTIAVLNPKGQPKVMLSGHIDEIGFMVTTIDKKGFISFRTIGGMDMHLVPGKRVHIHSKKGRIPGIIGRKAIHMTEPDERKKVGEVHSFWIDIGAKSDKAAGKLVEIGDPVTFVDTIEKLQGDLVAGRGFDDRIGAFVVAETLRLLKAKKAQLKAGVYGVASVQEEVGLRGAKTAAYGVDPLVGIAIDVGFATDHPGIDTKRYGEYALGKGPIIARGANINPKVYELLVKAAKKKKIPHQIQGIPGGTGTDANAIQLTRAGVAAGLLSVPLRYMHTPVEVLALKDLDNTAKLLAEFILMVDGKTDFIPK
jgi:putative aminopeptidase FrvX